MRKDYYDIGGVILSWWDMRRVGKMLEHEQKFCTTKRIKEENIYE